MTPRQVAEALDKNYHTTRCLLRKMEATGEIRHVNSHYIANVGDNSCHQRNQSKPSALQPPSQIAQSVEPCPSAFDYSDYGDYSHQSVSASESRTQSIPPPFGACSLQFPSIAEALLVEREVVPDSQNHGDDDVNSVICRNHRNQSMSATTQASDHVGQSSPKWTDYIDYADNIDYGDYADYANESVSVYWSQIHQPDPPMAGVSLQYRSAAGDLLTEKEATQDAQDHRVDYAFSVINRNQRNRFDFQYSQATLRAEQNESDSHLHLKDEPAGKARASPCAPNKNRCPHHPHVRWIRFDPSGQAWCDKMDCWDCYRLMKIGEALDYRPLAKYTRGIVTVGKGIEAWSSFVTSQDFFAVLTATQYAIDLCKALGIEVPDLSGEVQRLVSVRE